MKNNLCKSGQRRRLLKTSHSKINARYRVYYRVVLSNEEEEKNKVKPFDS